jgi:hypothetical protein
LGGRIHSFESLIKGVIKRYVPNGNVLLDVRSVWESCVGDVAARHTRPVGYTNDKLLVEVDDNHWKAELALYEQDILDRLASLVPHRIKAIHWKLVPSLSPLVKQQSLIPEEALSPPSPEVREFIDRSVQKIEDEKLRKAMQVFLTKSIAVQQAIQNATLDQNKSWR